MTAPNESPFRERDPISDADAVALLEAGDIDVLGRMPWSSNATFLCDIEADEVIVQGVYKPHRGERPLWDFPSGLYKREVAMYRLCVALGWDLIPPTVLRDGPAGPGSMQLFIPTDFDEHYFTLRDDDKYRPAFERLCVLDFVANSTDRKAGHCLVGRDDRIYGIDNGLSFHAEFKLRTVLWDYAGEPIPEAILADLGEFTGAELPDDLTELLDPFEADATLARARALLADGEFPTDPTGRRFPWPLV